MPNSSVVGFCFCLVTSCLGLVMPCISVAQSHVAGAAEPESQVKAPRAEVLLAQMSSALQVTNYSGEFTYESGPQLETYQIVHKVIDGKRFESLQRLSGEDANLVRVGDAGCGTIGGHLMAGARLSASDGGYFGLERYYHSLVAGEDRVAGRDAWVVQLVPKDEHRFGTVLSIDIATGMLLSQVIFDPRKKAGIERMQFVSLAFGEDAKDLATSANLLASQKCVGETYVVKGRSPWAPQWLPPGFILTGYSYSENTGHMESYTDGLAFFSIFVTDLKGTEGEAGAIQQGALARGATMALVTKRQLEGELRQVSVVGEIPLSVAQKVSLSIRRLTGGDGVQKQNVPNSAVSAANEPEKPAHTADVPPDGSDTKNEARQTDEG